MKTDAERIADRRYTASLLESLWRDKKITATKTVELHEECAGRGALDDGKSCVYCGGTGRVYRYVASLVVPFGDVP